MPKPALLLLGLAAPVLLAQAPKAKPDPWAPLRPLVGVWQGEASGEPGRGRSERRYEFVLNGRFLHERNTSTYAPKAEGGTGEVHEHWSFFSHDRARKAILFRQFHQEGFVITYALDPAQGTPTKLVFVSEQLENAPASWRARETYEWTSDDAFTETFELAQGDKPFAVYSRTRFTRPGSRG